MPRRTPAPRTPRQSAAAHGGGDPDPASPGPSSASATAGAAGIGRGHPSTAPLPVGHSRASSDGSGSLGGASPVRYTSLSSLMRSPDRETSSRMEWPGSPPSAGPSPRHAHFAPQQLARHDHSGSSGRNGDGHGHGSGGGARDRRSLAVAGHPAAPADDVPSWTIPGNGDRPPQSAPVKKREKRLSLWRLIGLTVAMGGSQIVWTVELGYGTPYLLSLGLEEKYTALVWLAGPISGLVVQPLIGAISDSSTSKYRRRFWVVASTALLVLALLGLAYTEPMAKAIVDLIGFGQGDWDPKGKVWIAIITAVLCFYILDFALNGLQASLRNLVFDVTPAEQLNSANAWNGRFNHIGNIVGFFMGFMNLNDIPVISFLGGDQFRKLSLLSLVILVVTVWITCFTIEEDERPRSFLGERGSTLRHMLNTIHDAIQTLPKPVRRICMVQIMAFMGWFPFLFYTTLYVNYVMSLELGHEANDEEATRAGSFALLIHAFVAYGAGTILPYLADRDRRLLPDEDDGDGDEQSEHAQVRAIVRQWKADMANSGRTLRLPRMPFMLRNMWTAALLLFFVLMMTTFFITTVWQATIMISLVGICWAVACWVPFEMIMAFLKEVEDEQDRAQNSGSSGSAGSHARRTSFGTYDSTTPPRTGPHGGRSRSRTWGHAHSASGPDAERRPLLMRSYSTADLEGASVEYIGQGPVAGGTIMGIHNLAIVLPQFIIAIVASIIFRVADGAGPVVSFKPGGGGGSGGGSGGESGGGSGGGAWHEKSGVAWVLRFGGLMALVGAAICRRVPPTKQEKIMRRRLAEMREAAADEQAQPLLAGDAE